MLYKIKKIHLLLKQRNMVYIIFVAGRYAARNMKNAKKVFTKMESIAGNGVYMYLWSFTCV